MSDQQTTKSQAENIEVIREIFQVGVDIRNKVLTDERLISDIAKSGDILLNCVKNGGTIYACGNGGSSNDAMHLVEELVARYKRERPGIRAMHLMDSAVLTCWSNDYSFDTVYERQVKTFCGKNDVLIAISTSGNSKNVIKAVEACKPLGTKTIALLGKDGGALSKMSDVSLIVPSNETERIQEVHITIIHILCELIER